MRAPARVRQQALLRTARLRPTSAEGRIPVHTAAAAASPWQPSTDKPGTAASVGTLATWVLNSRRIRDVGPSSCQLPIEAGVAQQAIPTGLVGAAQCHVRHQGGRAEPRPPQRRRVTHAMPLLVGCELLRLPVLVLRLRLGRQLGRQRPGCQTPPRRRACRRRGAGAVLLLITQARLPSAAGSPKPNAPADRSQGWRLGEGGGGGGHGPESAA